MLHTVNKSPFEKNSLQTCLSLSLDGSDILLLEDGVYGAIQGNAIAGSIEAAMTSKSFYALGPDLKARGIEEDKLIDGVKVVGYSDFVELAANNDRVQSWL
ncbi:MAG: tRNA 2-thiouridine synthesizing protein B [Parasphingorhabdus sp.]|jgi:tRNA 2-thiouridine synthesizing protein B